MSSVVKAELWYSVVNWPLAWDWLCILIGGFSGGIAVLLAALCFIGLRQVMVKRLGGTTGDTAGALLELLEAAVLVGLAL